MSKEKYDKLAEPNLPSEYTKPEMPETYFENIYAADQVNSPLYSLWQGQLHDALNSMTHIEQEDAEQVARYLNNGEVDQAEKLTGELLEEEK